MRRERLLELLERTAAYYERYLWESAEAARARAYLAGRGLAEETLRAFRVGYAPSAWDRVLLASRRGGFSVQELYATGLAQRSRQNGQPYDRFRGRIMFPLADLRGRPLGFGARALGAGRGPKYLNTSDNDIYHKGLHLYGAHLARAHAARAGRVILCEGYTDTIALHQAGIANAVGLMGTALTGEQLGGAGPHGPDGAAGARRRRGGAGGDAAGAGSRGKAPARAAGRAAARRHRSCGADPARGGRGDQRCGRSFPSRSCASGSNEHSTPATTAHRRAATGSSRTCDRSSPRCPRAPCEWSSRGSSRADSLSPRASSRECSRAARQGQARAALPDPRRHRPRAGRRMAWRAPGSRIGNRPSGPSWPCASACPMRGSGCSRSSTWRPRSRGS